MGLSVDGSLKDMKPKVCHVLLDGFVLSWCVCLCLCLLLFVYRTILLCRIYWNLKDSFPLPSLFMICLTD